MFNFKSKLLTHLLQQLPFILQERPIVTFKIKGNDKFISCKRLHPPHTMLAPSEAFVWITERTSLGDHLRAAQIEVDGVAVVLSQLSRLNEHFWVIGTKLAQTHTITWHNDIQSSADIIWNINGIVEANQNSIQFS